MQLESSAPRYVAGVAICIAHAAAIYAAATLAPPHARSRDPLPLAVHFIGSAPELPPPPRVREPKTVAPLIAADTPRLAPIDLSEYVAERPVEAPRAITVAATAPGAEQRPRLISTVEYVQEPSPRYPPQSRRLREQGVVVLRVLIDERGHACDIEIESSSGFARLDHAAREAVANAVFRPYFEDGAPRRALVRIPIEFSLRQASA